jgi:membrane protein YdbS with pleckstrin-like domain
MGHLGLSVMNTAPAAPNASEAPHDSPGSQGPAKAAGAPASPGRAAVSPRFDATFIEDHQLVDRYLENKLPPKGARELEHWCRAHPEYLNKLRLSERTQASLKLLEASGRALDLREPDPPWWKAPYVLIALAAITLVSLLAFWAMVAKYSFVRSELEETKVRIRQGPLVQPAVQTVQHVSPDHAPGIDRARISVSGAAPQLIDLHIDMSYTQKLNQFRIIVDKRDQGRALILNNLLKDSNNDLRLTFNTTGLSAGIYTVRIEALPPRGDPIPDGWLILEVN